MCYVLLGILIYSNALHRMRASYISEGQCPVRTMVLRNKFFTSPEKASLSSCVTMHFSANQSLKSFIA